MKTFQTREFNKVWEEFSTAANNVGRFQRIHSDNKSQADSPCSTWVRLARGKDNSGSWFEVLLVSGVPTNFSKSMVSTHEILTEFHLDPEDLVIPTTTATPDGAKAATELTSIFKNGLIDAWEVRTKSFFRDGQLISVPEIYWVED